MSHFCNVYLFIADENYDRSAVQDSCHNVIYYNTNTNNLRGGGKQAGIFENIHIVREEVAYSMITYCISFPRKSIRLFPY